MDPNNSTPISPAAPQAQQPTPTNPPTNESQPKVPQSENGETKMLLIALVVLIILIVLGVAGYFVYINFFAKKTEEKPAERAQTTEEPSTSGPVSLDSAKEATHLSKVLDTEGAYWQRMFELYWNEVEKEEGEFDWDSLDSRMKEVGEMEIYPIATIKPFANWDQDACHGSEYESDFDPMKGGNVKVGKPCDMNAYAEFLKKAVERYDGDGTNDMPGLKIPVKYWEIMNEPSMQGGSTGGMGEELKFFVGTSQEYLDILKTSYETIKKADPDAKVVQGGQAGMHEQFVEFWTPIFEGGGGDYFDVANIHSISTDERTEDLFVIKFKEFLKQYEIEDKPIFVTEVQFGQLAEKPDDLEEFEKLMVRSSVFSLAQGADVLFYIENWTFWDTQDPGKKSDTSVIKSSSTHKVYENLVDKINEFDEILKIQEKFIESPSDNEGAQTTIGQYKFVNGSSAVYVLWGEAEVPAEITGQIKVTDIYGESETMDASGLVLSDEPVFVETTPLVQ